MSESSESLCKLISNILWINWAIKRWYMLSLWFNLLALASACVLRTALVCKTCNYSVHGVFFFFLNPHFFLGFGLVAPVSCECQTWEKKEMHAKWIAIGTRPSATFSLWKKQCVHCWGGWGTKQNTCSPHRWKVRARLLEPRNFPRRCWRRSTQEEREKISIRDMNGGGFSLPLFQMLVAGATQYSSIRRDAALAGADALRECPSLSSSFF